MRLERVTEQVESDADSLVYLSEHGFVPGVDAEVQSKAPDGTLTLQLHDGTIALGLTVSWAGIEVHRPAEL